MWGPVISDSFSSKPLLIFKLFFFIPQESQLTAVKEQLRLATQENEILTQQVDILKMLVMLI